MTHKGPNLPIPSEGGGQDPEKLRWVREFIAAMRSSGITQQKLEAIERETAAQEDRERKAVAYDSQRAEPGDL